MSSFMQAAQRHRAHPVVRGGVARLITLPVTVVASFATTAITLHAVGSAAYGYVALVATLAILIPFADLGLGASVQTATAEAVVVSTDRHLERVLLSAFRLLALSGTVVVASAVVVAKLVGWSAILGVPADSPVRVNLLVPIVLALFAGTLPFGVGQRLLIGIERNDIAVTLAALGPPLALLAVALMSVTGAPIEAYVIVQPAAILVTAIVSLSVAGRMSGVSMRRVLQRSLHPGLHPGTSIAPTATPMFVIMVALPIALQSDRIVLAHRASATALTEYAVAAQIYAALWSVVYSAGVSLWPRFARQRARNENSRRQWALSIRAFMTVGIIAGVALGVVLPPLVRLISSGAVKTPAALAAAFAALIVVLSIHLPSGMLLTSPALLRFQAMCAVAMLAINLPVSWILAGSVGAAGPVIGSAISVGVAQALPGWLKARHVLSAAERAPTWDTPGTES